LSQQNIEQERVCKLDTVVISQKAFSNADYQVFSIVFVEETVLSILWSWFYNSY